MSEGKQDMVELGSQRFFKPSEINWNKELKDLEWKIKVDVTNENVDPDAMVTLNTLLKFIASKQGQPMTSDERLVFNKILMKSGTVSPVELSPATPTVSPMSSPLPASPTVSSPAGMVGA